MYIHELQNWPRFEWNSEQLAEALADVRHRQGRLIGHLEALGFEHRQEAVLETLTADVLKSSEIEGEKLDAEQVRSSIARRLGMEIGGLAPADRKVEGVVEMILDATGRYDQPLTAERLFAWHASLFPTGRSGMTRIRAGAWRDDSTGPMAVVSGPIGKKHVHFRAPPARRLDGEMEAFLEWFNAGAAMDPGLKAGLAHLWFVTVHPFDDGNGRIARAIAVKPEVLLLDEPTAALDPISTGKIEELIFQLKERYTIVIVTHNMQQAARVAEFTGFFLLGKLIEFDKTEKIFTKPSDKKTEDYITGRFG